MRGAPAMGEALLQAAWAERRYPPSALVDDRGRVVQVIFPGRRWGGPGPDFRGALLALKDGSLLRGDVEVHLRASGWSRHRHAADPAYARVILHVVGFADAPPALAGGHPIPTVVLAPDTLFQGAPLPIDLAFPVPPCRHAAPSPPDVHSALASVNAAGLRRFAMRRARFEGDLASLGPDQTVWRAVAEALGYNANTATFRRLADAVPYAEAADLAATDGEAGASVLLLGAAGLLPLVPLSSAERSAADRLGAALLRPRLGVGAWNLAAVRPASHPAIRCRGLAALLTRWTTGAEGPAATLLRAVQRDLALPSAAAPRALLQSLTAAPWIGGGRARTIAANVALPFAAADGLEGVEALFQRFPGEPPNRVTRAMAAQLGLPFAPRFACQLQGLLALFKDTCESRLCAVCPAAVAERTHARTAS